MRCWNPTCRRLMPHPEIIDGRKANPGELRRKERNEPGEVHIIDQMLGTEDAAPGWEVRGITSDFECPHCGTKYETAMRVTGKPTKVADRRTPEERGNGWD